MLVWINVYLLILAGNSISFKLRRSTQLFVAITIAIKIIAMALPSNENCVCKWLEDNGSPREWKVVSIDKIIAGHGSLVAAAAAATTATQTIQLSDSIFMLCLQLTAAEHTAHKNKFKVIQQNRNRFSHCATGDGRALWFNGYILSRTRNTFRMDKRRKYDFHIALLFATILCDLSSGGIFFCRCSLWLLGENGDKNNEISGIKSFWHS